MIDPEAGVEAGSDLSGLGSIQSPYKGTGEGYTGNAADWNWDSFQRLSRRPDRSGFYEQIGKALQAQQASQAPIGGLIGDAYNPNWLAQQEHAGSAEGQKL